jgi:hypothetical protein
MLARLLLLMRNSVAAPGQQVFTSSGTFTVPAGVTSICAVAVGRGKDGAMGDGMGTPGRGGDGGTLSYSNAISVTPGESLTVTIATSTSSSTGETTLKRSSTVLLAARAGGQTSGQANVGTSFAGGTAPDPFGGYGTGIAGRGRCGTRSRFRETPQLRFGYYRQTPHLADRCGYYERGR